MNQNQVLVSNQHRRVQYLSLVLLIAVSMMAGGRVSNSSDDPRVAIIRAKGNALRSLQRPLPPAEKGDWLAEHREAGQSFDEYIDSNPNRPNRQRTTLYIQPLGEFQGPNHDLLAHTTEFLGLFYSLPVKTLKPINLDVLPESARRVHPRWDVKQIDSLTILDLLRKNRPDDAVGVLGLTATDLWPNEKGRAWNFVFGQASLGNRVGVWSIARLGEADKDYQLVLRRTLKVAVHETGHMFGIQHCVHYLCGMNGSNNLTESDRQPMPFCSECEMKVWWACTPDITKRYKLLEVFAKTHKLDEEAKFWGASANK